MARNTVRDFRIVVTPARFERATPRLGIWCSIQLSYGAPAHGCAPYVTFFRTATIPDLGLRRRNVQRISAHCACRTRGNPPISRCAAGHSYCFRSRDVSPQAGQCRSMRIVNYRKSLTLGGEKRRTPLYVWADIGQKSCRLHPAVVSGCGIASVQSMVVSAKSRPCTPGGASELREGGGRCVF